MTSKFNNAELVLKVLIMLRLSLDKGVPVNVKFGSVKVNKDAIQLWF